MPSTYPEQTLTGGEVIVELLRRFGVDVMFGLPGDQTAIYDAIYQRGDIRHVLVRHEQAAAHMADAYARRTGRVGVCDAAVGPGATNLVSGISEAWTSGIPVIAMASAIRSDWQGRNCFQEIDQVSVFQPITKLARSVDQVAQIPQSLRTAFAIATSGRPGPVFLSFPLDVLKATHQFTAADLAVDDAFALFPCTRPEAPPESVRNTISALSQAHRPVILAGGGVVASGAMTEVQALAERLGIPVATTFMGKGSIAENHPLSLGPFGLIGRSASNTYVLESDFALAIGTRFTNVDTAAWRIPSRNTTIAHIDIDAKQIGRFYPAEIPLPGDARSVLRQMLDALDEQNVPPGDSRRRHLETEVRRLSARWRTTSGIESSLARDTNTSPVHPLQVIRALRNVMRPDDALICDSGFNQIWGGQYFELQTSGRYYMGPRGFGVMGFSLPAAIANHISSPDIRTFALCGDGGFAMVMQELETAHREQIPVVVCVMNNSNLQYIKENQRILHGARYISTDFSPQNYAAIARAFGIFGARVENSRDLEATLHDAVASGLPAVVDIQIPGDIVPERLHLQKLDEPHQD